MSNVPERKLEQVQASVQDSPTPVLEPTATGYIPEYPNEPSYAAPPLSLTRRRWRNFRANRRAYVSFWIFLVLLALTLPAELVANDKPLLVRYDGALYFPVFVSYPETTFGGDFDSEADYRDPFVQDLISAKGWALWPPIRFSYDTVNYDLGQPSPAPPSRQDLLGTDDQARDVLARVVYGFRVSILFALILTVLSSAVGVAAGVVQGYFGGWLDLGFQRFIEIWGGIPTLYLLIILSSLVRTTFWVLLRAFCCCSAGWGSSGWSAPKCCAPATSTSYERRGRWVYATAALCSGTSCPTRSSRR